MNRSIAARRSLAISGMGVLGAAVLAASLIGPSYAASRPPLAPADLTVGDREHPLNVEGTPSFGWLPQDLDPGEIQTAYQITVRDGGDVIWDSGKVGSGEQSYVPYGGPELADGAAYSWSVRTWDRDDQPSPWASAAAFETGIPDGGWDGAQWIQRPGRQSDEWFLARTEVALQDKPVTRARAYVAGSHTYELRIDGERADRGQSFGYAGENYYQASDVTALVDGKDEIALGAVVHWYGSGQGRPSGQAGLLVRLVVEYADGSRQVVVSDGSWKVADGPYATAARRNGEGDYIEHLDARLVPNGWDNVGYDDAGWVAPIVLGPHPVAPFTHLTGQETRLTETTVEPVEILTAADGTPVIDFGVVIPARPEVVFDSGVAGRTVQMRAGYNLTETGRVATSTLLTQGTNMTFPYTQVDGPQEFSAFTHLGFRYLEIPGAGEEIELDDVSAVVVHTDTPAGREAEFDSSDATLDEVWDMMARSAIYSVQEAFVDTPTREKGQFLGDAANISYATMGAFGERDATQQALREFLNSGRRFWTTGNDIGRYNAVYPNGDGKRDIPDYSLMFVDWVWRYYQESGDRQLLAEAFPSILGTVDYVLRHIPAEGPTAGLVTRLSGGSGQYLYGIVDWPEPGRFGYDMSAAARTTINAQSVDVLRDAAAMSQALGRPAEEAATLNQRADQLVERMNATLRRADGVYIDGLALDGTPSTHAGQHSTTYAIAHRVAPEADWPELAEYVEGLGMKQGPMTAHWILQALADAGRPDAVQDFLTNEDDLGWANILAQGGTFTWEAWTLDPGSNFSQSHGWGAQAVVDIQQTILGVRTTTPGAATIEIAPPAAGPAEASGTVPTQRGLVDVQWRRVAGGVVLEVDVPVNVTARISLPLAEGRAYRATGRSEATYLGEEDGRAIFEVGSGRSMYVPTAQRSGR